MGGTTAWSIRLVDGIVGSKKAGHVLLAKLKTQAHHVGTTPT